MSAYYNEIDPFAAQWLRELIKAGLIADGEVDQRDIRDVRADDVRGFTQCHFFAGIGGWSYALRLAGWDDARPVWTGSCPCQPFSAAGANAGGDDPRHLWPAWFRLIRECRPPVVFGEQVAAAINHGWLDLVFDDLEAEGYAAGAVGLPACSVGAFHIRQRLWFVAEEQPAHTYRDEDGVLYCDRCDFEPLGGECGCWHGEMQCRDCGEWTYPFHYNLPGDGCQWCGSGRLAHARGAGRAEQRGRRDEPQRSAATSLWRDGELADAASERRQHESPVAGVDGSLVGAAEPQPGTRRGGDASFWSDVVWLPCRDGKARPTQPGLFPLAHGVSNRVGILRGAGNAIVPQVAQAFIEAYLDTEAERLSA